VLSANAGKYEGTFTGDDAGTWKTTLTQDGTVKGTGISDDLGNFKVFGKSSCDGAFLAGNASTGASFAGTNRNGVISGFWVNPLYGESGTFYGEKVE
jgi:hypothetical protein